MRTTTSLLLALVLAACTTDKTADDTGGITTDGGAADGGSADGGAADGGAADGGSDDGGAADGGNADGGSSDGGSSDGGMSGDGGAPGDGGAGDGGFPGDGGAGDGGAGDGGVPGDGGAGDGGSGDTIAREGKWIYDEVAVTATSCAKAASLLPTAKGENFFITDSTSTGFTKEIATVGKATTCTYRGGGLAFDCDTIKGDIDVSEYSVTLPTVIAMDGELWSDVQADGSYSVEIDCIGDNCALAETLYGITFPCTFELDWIASHESL